MAPKKRAPEAHVNHAPFDVPERAVGMNTPKKAGGPPPSSKVWQTVKRLKAKDPRSQTLLLAGYTHICTFPLEADTETGQPRYCHEPLPLTRPNGTWIQTVAQRHLENEHPTDPAAIEAKEREDSRAKAKLELQLKAENPTSGSQASHNFALTKEQADLSTQAAWYVYAKMHVSKNAFEDKYWKSMLCQAGASCLLTKKQLILWVRAEFEVFKLFLRHILDLKRNQAQGNAFAQFLHDGGTLASHKKYQALAMQFIMPDWSTNMVICFGFPRSKENKDIKVAELSVLTFEEVSGYKFDAIFASAISDRAAKGVAGELGLVEEVCAMHDGDKLGQSATGALVRSKNKRSVNPFPEGVKLMANARKMGTDFTWDTWHEKLWALGEQQAGADAVPHIKIKVDLNGTRVAAQHSLLLSELRLYHALRNWHLEKSTIAKPLTWDSSPAIWKQMAELESVLNVTKITTTLAQHEHLYTGAFGGLIKRTTMAGLRSDTLNVIDLTRVNKTSKLPRIAVPVSELTELGLTARMRATLEGERRMCGNTTEEVTGAEVILNGRELMASLLDLRTIRVQFLTSTQQQQALKLLESAYVKYAKQAVNFNREAVMAREAKAKAEAEAALAEAAVKRAAAGEASASAAEPEPNKEMKQIVTSGASYGAVNPWVAEDEPEAAGQDDDECDLHEVHALQSDEGYKIEFKKVWRNWVRLPVSWSEYYPDLKPINGPSGGEYDLIHDLMPLDMGVLYKKIIASDPERKVYGHLPYMAGCSEGQIGALNAESFCERVLSCSNLVVSDGNTLLEDEEVTKMVILRMNRGFMEYMRANYNAASRQKFNTTVVVDHGPESE